MNNLKEKYIEGRIIEKFGRSDIVSFLSIRADYRGAWMACWKSIATLLFPYPKLGEPSFGDIITKFERPLKDRLGVGGTSLTEFVSYWLLQRPEVEVYSLYPNYFVKFQMTYQGKKLRDQFSYCVIGRDESKLTAEDVVYTLTNFCWINPDETEHIRHRNQIPGAREFLISRLQREVDVMIRLAQNDFSSACAVSADGKKITRADRVIVVKNDGTLPIFDAELFCENKIERPEKMCRVKAYTTEDVRRTIGMVKKGEYDAVYAAAYNMKWSDDLVIAERFVSQPLPQSSGRIVADIV